MPESASLLPVLVDSSGRDGSTLMMRLLASSPEIAVPGPYPWERRYFAYLWRWARMLERTDRTDFWGPGDLGSLKWDAGKPLIGPPPWPSTLLRGDGDARPEMSRVVFDDAWREFSQRATAEVRAEHGDPAANVRYYAEKHEDTRLVDLTPLPPLRVIVLLRDPRDVFVSVHAFDARRRREDGGRFVGAVPAPGETEAEMTSRFLASQRERMRWIAGLPDDANHPVFRYEDLVADLAAQARRLEALLAVSVDTEAAAGDPELRGRHVSAASVEASVGRWRTEMSAETTQLFARELRDELEALGYAV